MMADGELVMNLKNINYKEYANYKVLYPTKFDELNWY
jgi:hypothetical protein